MGGVLDAHNASARREDDADARALCGEGVFGPRRNTNRWSAVCSDGMSILIYTFHQGINISKAVFFIFCWYKARFVCGIFNASLCSLYKV